MKTINYSNNLQKEAILNECKGNLFEFLVGRGLSKRSFCEDQFLLNLPLDFKDRLLEYEELIRENEPKLLIELPHLADKTVESLWNKFQSHHFQFSRWSVIGKMVASNDSNLWHETDLVGTIITSEGSDAHLPLSLKLSKDHSFTNTKSAGVKSFLSKYFEKFNTDSPSLIEKLQTELSNEVDESFLQMGHRLYSMNDLEWKGRFDSLWTHSFSELPGELTDEMRNIVYINYNRIAIKLHDSLCLLKNKNSTYFYHSLAALCGFSDPDILQVNCFHHDYVFSEVTIKSMSEFFSATADQCVIKSLKPMSASVEIQIGNVDLQIRVKPMNKFTSAAYKINCSTKMRDNK